MKEKGTRNSRSWLHPTLIGMGLTSFLSDCGHEAATAILPVFLGSMGAPPLALGTIEGISDAVSSISKIGAGWLGDRIPRRKPLVVSGYAVTGLATALFGFATAWPHLLISRSLAWLGRGIRSPLRDAMLADSVEPAARGRAFGFERAGDTLGAVAGPAAGLTLLGLLSFRSVFLFTLLPGLLAAATYQFLVKERLRTPGVHVKIQQTLSALPSRFRLFLVAVLVFGAGDFAHSLLILRASELLAPGFGAAHAGRIAIGMYVLHNVVYAGASYPAGALGDRFGRRNLLAGGYVLGALVSLAAIVTSASVAAICFLFAVAGLSLALEDTLERAMAADLLPEELRATGYGFLAAANSIGDLLSSLIVGLLWTAFGPWAGFGYAALVGLAGAGLLLLLTARSAD